MIANKKIDFRHVVKQPESQTLEICSFTLTLALTKGQKMALGKGSRKKAAVLLAFVNHGQKYFVGDITF